jgi:hypothetical protein
MDYTLSDDKGEGIWKKAPRAVREGILLKSKFAI